MKRLIAIFAIIAVIGCSAQSNLMGNWTGTLDLKGMGSLKLGINLTTSPDGTVVCTLDSPDQGAKGLPTRIDHCTDDSITIVMPQLSITYSARLVGDELQGTFTQMGVSLPFNMKRGEEKIGRPQTPISPYPYKTEEVTFENTTAGATLAGTLTYPIGYENKKPGSVPVVLLVTGSGLQNRDEEIMDHKPFLVIADYLARNGIASLRYDDRGTAASTGGDLKNATTQDFALDAMAGADFLRLSKKFGKQGVIGHSEGANIAFILASRGRADFVVSLAGVGVKGDTALTAQANCIMQLGGMPGNATTRDYRNMMLLQNNPWLTWFINYNPAGDIAATRCPVYAANGDKDCQVIANLNLNGIKAALPENQETRIVEYPGLNHFFQECNTGAPTEYRSIEQTISPQLLKDITEWIKNLK